MTGPTHLLSGVSVKDGKVSLGTLGGMFLVCATGLMKILWCTLFNFIRYTSSTEMYIMQLLWNVLGMAHAI